MKKRFALLALTGLIALAACHHAPACAVLSDIRSGPPGHVLLRSPACAASDATTYRWVRGDGTFGKPGADGLNLMPGEQIGYSETKGNGSHAEYALNGGEWVRIEGRVP